MTVINLTEVQKLKLLPLKAARDSAMKSYQTTQKALNDQVVAIIGKGKRGTLSDDANTIVVNP